MPRVDFYLLNRLVANGRLLAACRLSHKIHSLGRTALIQTADSNQAKTLDDLMWTFDQSSFIPHGLHDESGEVAAQPIAIGHQPPSKFRHNVLISLLDTVPDYFDQYQRIAEFIDDSEQDKAQARNRFRVYRDHGCILKTHDIKV